jgi:hypothetical protein
LLFVDPQDSTGWAGLGYIIMLVLSSVVFITYVLAWFIVSLINKNKAAV